MGGVILGLQAQIHHVVDALGDLGFVGQDAFKHLLQSRVIRGPRLNGRHLRHPAAFVHEAHELEHVLTLFFRVGVQEFGDAVKALGFGPNCHREVGVRALAFQANLLVQCIGNGVV